MDPTQIVREELIPLLPRLRRLARALAGNVADADDLLQTVLERALTRAEQWRPDAALDKWVFAIARNAWRDELRARGRSQMLFAPEEAGVTAADDSSAPAQKLELAAARADLYTQLASLDYQTGGALWPSPAPATAQETIR